MLSHSGGCWIINSGFVKPDDTIYPKMYTIGCLITELKYLLITTDGKFEVKLYYKLILNIAWAKLRYHSTKTVKEKFIKKDEKNKSSSDKQRGSECSQV